MSSDRENKIKRLLYQSWYRGCKETDRLLGWFAKQYIHDFDDQELTMFEEILNETDKDLFNWITGKEDLPDRYKNNKVMKLVLAFDFAKEGAASEV